jgi:hypothetical protein
MESSERPSRDVWGLWFFRLVQAVGLALLVFEFLSRESPRMIVVATAIALTSGALGVEKILTWLTRP